MVRDTYNSNNKAKNYLIKNLEDPLGEDKGFAKRRYLESELFGLYNSRPAVLVSQEEATSIYQVFTKNRDYMLAYEAAYGRKPDGSTGSRGDQTIPANELLFTAMGSLAFLIMSLKDELHPAANSILEHYVETPGYGNTTDFNPLNIQIRDGSLFGSLVGEDGNDHTGSNKDLLIGSAAIDFVYGGAGYDVLYGIDGDDYLFGGTGDWEAKATMPIWIHPDLEDSVGTKRSPSHRGARVPGRSHVPNRL